LHYRRRQTNRRRLPGDQRQWFTLLTVGMGVAAGLSFAAGGPDVPTTLEKPPLQLSEIVDRMMERRRAQEETLLAYTSHRRYRVHNLRFNKIAEMAVRLTYARTEGKSFDVLEESGPAPIRNKALRKMLESEVEASRGKGEESSDITSANYDFRFLRMEREGPRGAYVLEAEPKRESKYLLRGSIWVDMQDFGISRIEGSPAKKPSFWIRGSTIVYQFEKVGDFWLPKSTQSEAEVRLFGRTDLNIAYGQYEIKPQ
jgi:hypothetical protein